VDGGSAAGRTREATTAAALRVLADLAPNQRQASYDASANGRSPIAWVHRFEGTSIGDPFIEDPDLGFAKHPVCSGSEQLETLEKHSALSPGLETLRIGWLWIAGEVVIDGKSRQLLLPLLSRPVEVRTTFMWQRSIRPLAPWDLWPLVDDEQVAARLEADACFGGGAIDLDTGEDLMLRLTLLEHWVQKVMEASHLPPVERILAPGGDLVLAPGQLVGRASFAIYPDRAVDPSQPRQILEAWSLNQAATSTAFATLYCGDGVDRSGRSVPAAGSTPYDAAASPFTLNERQADVVLAARTSPVTVVSGPPGTGKSHTAAAIALDTVANGQSVLIATQTNTAADVLAELLERVPGPTPVLFGSGERASRLAATLADGVLQAVHDGADDTLADRERSADELAQAVFADLVVVAAEAEWEHRVLALPAHALVAPRLLDDGATVSATDAVTLLDAARTEGGWLARRRARRSEAELRAKLGSPKDTPFDAIADAVDFAALRDVAGRIDTRSITDADGRWEHLIEVDAERRAARAEALADRAARSANAGHRAVAALAAALRAGRAARRAHLAGVDVEELTAALPLWVGTLGDIEAMLPATAAAFDVVILDEASQIDQVSASAALLRADRVVIIGDPRQLRPVSFVADDEVSTSLATHRVHDLSDRLDIRRVSAFDLGASVAPVVFLDEHYRSTPHLIGFSAKRFYNDRLLVATRNLVNESALDIELRPVGGTRVAGVNQAEVDAALAEVEAHLHDGTGTIGIISPYRPQADAIRDAVSRTIALAVLETGQVRVGTVHEFQGGECDLMVASLAISDPGGRERRFLEDPNLFNVMITRARRHFVVLSSVTDPPPGLLADYLRWAVTPPEPPPDVSPADGWTERLAEVLRDSGETVRTGYRVGRQAIDLVVGSGLDAVAVSTRVAADGPDAHLRRHLALARAGWRQAEAFPSTFDGDAVQAGLAIRDRCAVPR